MRYPWIFVSILAVWVALGTIMTKTADRSDPMTLYVIGVVLTTIVALKGFKAES